ncbi:Ig-like domain-containing protein [Propionibacteriaceae bacterium Y1700]|uniref:Ig-like domain-containing protein n=1 Tax=Microlunatus sp. Y1700 TaxID=3418487 RepID=UPI003DA7075B
MPNRGRRRTSRWLPTAVVTAVAAALVTAMVVTPGHPAADLHLDDGSVWVTNAQRQLVGHLNAEIDELSSGTPMPNRDVDVVQDGDEVLTRDLTTNQMQRLDSSSTTLGGAVILPAKAEVGLAQQQVSVSDPATGRAWARSVDAIVGVDFAKAKPDFDLGPGGILRMAADGTAVGLSPTRGEIVRPDGDGLDITKVPFAMDPTRTQFSVAGDRAVVLDQQGGQVWVEGADPVPVPLSDTARLAAPTDQQVITPQGAVQAVLANGSSLYGVRLSGLQQAELITLSEGASGTPVEPQVVNGCAYGAWTGGTAVAAQVCSKVAPRITQLSELGPDANLTFRVNRNVVVLNDLNNGLIWVASKNMQLISNWDSLAPPKPKQGDGTEDDDTTEKVDPNRSARNQPPVAEDDQHGARAGRTTNLPVVKNDTDPDGDILTVSKITEVSGVPGATVAPVRGGTSLQIQIPEGATGTLTFGYTIDDGRKGTDTATVNVEVVDPSPLVSNRAPAMYSDTEPLVVGLGQKGTKRVGLDWFDPDGDELIFTDATVEGDDEVAIDADGVLSWTDVGTKAGRKTVTVTATDGVNETEGPVVVDVRKSRDLPPLANGDFATARAGQSITLKPLENDLGTEPMLMAVDQATNATVEPDFNRGVINFTAERPGTYYLSYTISTGAMAKGLIRIDVSDPAEENAAPVAAKDVALLPAGGSTLINPLANDEDPDDDVLVIQSVSADPSVKVRIVQREMLELTSVTTPTEPVELTYSISDGQHQVTGAIVVMPAEGGDRRPVAEPDETVVRAGETVSVRVLGNDSSPAGLPLTLTPELAEEPEAGQAWTDGEYVRFVAPQTAGDHRAVYQVTDSEGHEASAQVRFQVLGHDVENTPPEVAEVTGRVLAGTENRIVIPLEGLDPQGDAVRLLGIDSAPELGRVVSVDQRWLVYEAYEKSAGTDSFTYAVTDSLGARATGTVRIGVVPRDAKNNPPITVDDTVKAKPGRPVTVNALGNDADPDNDPFGFTEDPFRIEGGGKVVNASSVRFRMPLAPGTTVGQYRIADRRGAEATGNLTIVSDPNAPLLAPVPTDDIVTAGQVAGKEVVEVPVLDNDVDPDGDIAAATVSLPEAAEGGPQVVGSKVRIPVGDTMQSVRYEVTDSDGQKAWAVVVVPGRADAVPGLRTDVKPQTIEAGKTLSLDINEFVVGTRGRQVSLTEEDRVWGTNGESGVEDTTTVTFVAPEDYVGPAAVTFEVTDGKDNNDPDGRKAVLTVPIEVVAPPDLPADVNKPPNVSPMTLTVGAGDGPKSADLAKAAFDPEKQKLTFTEPKGKVPPKVKVSWSGSVLTVEAEPDAQPTDFELRGTVRDDVGAPVDTVLSITVRETDRTPPKAVDDVVTDAVQGRAVNVAVLGNDVNPFADRSEPLQVTGGTIESGTGTAKVNGDRLTVTPGADFVGTLIVRYQISDAAGRRAEARVKLTVKGKPAKPGVPRVDEVADQRAVLTWTAPNDNGAAITDYTVRGTGNGSQVKQQCSTTTCTITGLTNNVTYRFTVTATNAIGESDRSGSSAEVRPDVKPETPGTPTPKFGDKAIDLTWPAAESKGSPVKKYDVQTTGPGGGLRSVGNVTATTVSGLTNGSAYRFRVRAHNSSGEPSNWSPWSRGEVPAGKPTPPRSVVLSDAGGNLGKRVKISWQAPASVNGAKVTSYQVFANGKQIGRTDGRRTLTASLANGSQYTVYVTATNKAGASEPSKRSAAFTPYGAPERPAAPKLKATGTGPGNVTNTWAAPKTNGHAITSYQVEASGGPQPPFKNSPETVRANPGAAYKVRFRACSNDKCSPVSAWAKAVEPYGPPGAPGVRAKGNATSVSFNWTAGTAFGKAPLTHQFRTSINGGAWTQWKGNPPNPINAGNDYEQGVRVQMRAKNTAGQYSPVAEASARTDKRPNPKVVVSKGGTHGSCDNPAPDCAQILITISEFPANKTVRCLAESERNHKGEDEFKPKWIPADAHGGGTNRENYFGFPGERVRAHCDGTTSDWFTW